MTFQDIKLFTIFYEFRNLSEVAIQCNLSQPSVSYRLKKIEDAVECKLYTYDGKFHFTKNGEEFYTFCKNSLSDYSELKKNLSDRNEIKVSLSSVAADFFLKEIYSIIVEAGFFPNIITASSELSIRNVIEDKSLFAIVGGIRKESLPKGICCFSLMKEHVSLIYNSKLPDEIDYIPILIDDSRSGLNKSIFDYLLKFEECKIIGEVGKSSEKMQLIEDNNIGFFLPDRYIEKNRFSKLTYKVSKKYGFSRDIHFMYNKKNENNKIVQKTIEILNRSTLSIK